MGKQRQKILAAAEKCISKEGFDKLSIRRITELANISNGALYIHFRNKQDIILGLLESHLHRWQNLSFNTCNDFKEFLHSVIEEAWKTPLLEHQNDLRLFVGVLGSPTLNDASFTFFNERSKHIHRIFYDLKTRDQIAPHYDIELGSQWLITFLHGFHLTLAFSPPDALNRAKDILDLEIRRMALPERHSAKAPN